MERRSDVDWPDALYGFAYEPESSPTTVQSLTGALDAQYAVVSVAFLATWRLGDPSKIGWSECTITATYSLDSATASRCRAASCSAPSV